MGVDVIAHINTFMKIHRAHLKSDDDSMDR